MSNLEFTPVRPCIKCGATDRYKSGKCIPCVKAQNAEWREANADKHHANSAAWDAANPDKKKANAAAWYAANADKVSAMSAAWKAANAGRKKATSAAWREANAGKANAKAAEWRAVNADIHHARSAAWRAANPEICKIYKQNRRARKTASGGALSKGLAVKLFKLQKGKCPCCRQPLGDDYHLDHKMPLALGGQNTDDNMQLLRSVCNLQKHAKHPVDFMQSRGFLL